MAKKTSIEHFKEARDEIISADVKPVYFFCGEEEFFLDRLQETVESLITDDLKDFNFDLLYGGEVTPDQILSIIRSYPMMAERRIVILRDFSNLNTGNSSNTSSGATINDLIPYFEQPNPSTLFVMFDRKKPNMRSRFGKAIKKNKHVGFKELKPVPDYRLPDWVIHWIHDHYKRSIEPEAAQLLAQYVGGNLQIMSTEIDKVCTFVDRSESIKEEHIKKIIGVYREYSVFDLKEALFSRDLDKSLFISEQMLQHTNNDTGEIIRSVGFFYSVFSNIWQIQRLAGTGNTKKQVQNKMGINNTWYFNKLWEDASKFELNETPRVFEALLDADRAAKGFSTLDPASIFLLTIKRIIN